MQVKGYNYMGELKNISYDELILERMRRYYQIDDQRELLKFIKYSIKDEDDMNLKK